MKQVNSSEASKGCDSNLKSQISQVVGESDDVVFLPEDFCCFAPIVDINRALEELVEAGELVPIGERVLAKSRKNRLTGETMLSATGGFDEVAKAALDKLGVEWERGTAEQNYELGCNQIPGKTIVRIFNATSVPKIAFKKFELLFE